MGGGGGLTALSRRCRGTALTSRPLSLTRERGRDPRAREKPARSHWERGRLTRPGVCGRAVTIPAGPGRRRPSRAWERPWLDAFEEEALVP